MPENYIKFLGTAGARFVMAKQLRYSAGTFLSLAGRNVMLDPGPGTLLRCSRCRPKIDPTDLDAVVLTHMHIDHSGDVNAVLDAMTAGGFNSHGTLFAPEQCLEGEDAVVLKYLHNAIESIQVLEPESGYSVEGLRFSTSVRHHHTAETYGVIFRPQDLPSVGFLVDTEYFDGLADAYADADVLVISVVRHEAHPSGKVMHLTLEEARDIIEAVQPRKALMTHFGMTMLKAKPWELAEEMSQELGLDIQAASDGLTLDLEEDV